MDPVTGFIEANLPPKILRKTMFLYWCINWNVIDRCIWVMFVIRIRAMSLIGSLMRICHICIFELHQKSEKWEKIPWYYFSIIAWLLMHSEPHNRKIYIKINNRQMHQNDADRISITKYKKWQRQQHTEWQW